MSPFAERIPDRAQSETVGVLLLVAVVVILVVGAGAVVVSNWQATTASGSQVNIQSSLTNSSLTLEHMGGDTLSSEDVLVVVRTGGDDHTLTNESNSDEFGPGTRWQYGWSEPFEGEATLRIFDESTGTLLYERTYDL